MTDAPAPETAKPALAIVGLGRMGQAVDALATSHGWPVRARIGRGQPITRASLAGAIVAIEFTTGTTAAAHVRACVAAGCAVVVGTTGWYDALPALRAEIEQSGGAMLWAPNFSVGALAMGVAAAAAARALRASRSFDPHLGGDPSRGQDRRAIGHRAGRRRRGGGGHGVCRSGDEHSGRPRTGRARDDFRRAIRATAGAPRRP